MPAAPFTDQVDAAADHYFQDLLPRFIDRYFRGQGYGFVAHMLDAHDREDLTSILAGPKPSRKATRMARRVRTQCPLTVELGGLEAWGATLGLFTKRGTSISGEMLGSYRVVDESWTVQIFEAPFARMDPEQREAALLLTIFHEYIHYFESFFVQTAQPLRGREQGFEAGLSLAEAEALDGTSKRRSRRGFVALGLVVLLIAWWVVNPTFDTQARQEVWQTQLRSLASAHAALDRLEADPSIGPRQQAVRTEIARRAQSDAAYLPDLALKRLAAHGKVPKAWVSGVAQTCGDGEAAPVLETLAQMPALSLALLTVGRGWCVVAKLPLSVAGIKSRFGPFPAFGRPPMFQSEHGRKLRAEVAQEQARLAERLTTLQPSADLAATEAALVTEARYGRFAPVADLYRALRQQASPRFERGTIKPLKDAMIVAEWRGDAVANAAYDFNKWLAEPVVPNVVIAGWVLVSAHSDRRGGIRAGFVPFGALPPLTP